MFWAYLVHDWIEFVKYKQMCYSVHFAQKKELNKALMPYGCKLRLYLIGLHFTLHYTINMQKLIFI